MQKKSFHHQRTTQLVQRQLAKEITMLMDAQFLGFTLSFVTLSKDLSLARVYFTLLDNTLKDSCQAFLQKQAKTLRYQLAHQLSLRRTPLLQFYYDDALDRGSRIESLLAVGEV